MFYLLYKHVTPSVSLSPLLTNEEAEVEFRAGQVRLFIYI